MKKIKEILKNVKSVVGASSARKLLKTRPHKKTILITLPIFLLLIAALIAVGITIAAGNTTEPETEQTFTEEGDGYYIWVRAVDHAGNKGPWSEAQRVWIDASGPSAPTITGGNTAYALSRTISVVTEADDNGASGVAYYEYYKKSGADKPAATVEGTKVTTSATSQKFDTNIAGDYVFFRAVDVVGNKGAWSDGQQVYIDVNVPTVTCKQANSTLTIKQGDNLELLDYFTITPTGTNTAYTAKCKVGSTEYSTTESFTAANSPYTVTCTGTITGGNSNSATMKVVVEAAGPANIDQATTIQSATTEYVDDKGNSVWVPGGYKIIVDTTVDKGVVIADNAGNEFVWIPIGTITKADGTKVTIDLGRYTFDITDGTPKVEQAGNDWAAETVITEEGDGSFQELATSRTGDGATTNTTAKNLQQFIEKTTLRGGYYLGRYESSNSSTGNSLKGKTPVTTITQLNAATAARAYKNGDKYVSADLVNSYMWDTAIVFIQKCSNLKSYSIQMNGSGNRFVTGASSDNPCNIYDMNANYWEWSTEFCSEYLGDQCAGGGPLVVRQGYLYSNKPDDWTTCERQASIKGMENEYGTFRVGLWVL